MSFMNGLLNMMGFGQKISAQEPHAPAQGITPIPTPAERVEQATHRPRGKNSQGKSNRYMSALRAQRLKAKRARQARKNSKRGVSNPKHLRIMDVRLAA